jgi:hypothetical protein
MEGMGGMGGMDRKEEPPSPFWPRPPAAPYNAGDGFSYCLPSAHGKSQILSLNNLAALPHPRPRQTKAARLAPVFYLFFPFILSILRPPVLSLPFPHHDPRT